MFSIPTAQLAIIRAQAVETMRDHIDFYTIDIVRDRYGNETYVSGIVSSTVAYIGRVGGKDDEIVNELRTQGKIGNRVATLLTPYGDDTEYEYIVHVSGGNDWRVVWNNKETTDDYQIYAKAIITRDEPLTNYKDQYRRNG